MAARTFCIARLREMFVYDAEAGSFRWRTTYRNAVAGEEAGTVRMDGYRILCVDGTRLLAHRIAWAMLYGEWPRSQVDHMNGVRSDNSARNLRVVTHAENCQNLRACNARNQSSGLLGVTWSQRKKKWKSGIKSCGKSYHLGYFSDKHEAFAAYVGAKRRLHPGGLL